MGYSTLYRSVSVIIACIFLVATATTPLMAQEQSPKIKLKRGFFKPLKFTYGDSEPQNVYTFSGLSFRHSFRETIGLYPPALRQANRARIFNGIALGGAVGLLVFSIKMLVDTLDEANQVSQGVMVDDSFEFNDVVPFIVCGSVMIVGSILGYQQLKRGVSTFNKNSNHITKPAREQSDTGMRETRQRGINLAIGLKSYSTSYNGNVDYCLGIGISVLLSRH